jgi:hypothetical protein
MKIVNFQKNPQLNASLFTMRVYFANMNGKGIPFYSWKMEVINLPENKYSINHQRSYNLLMKLIDREDWKNKWIRMLLYCNLYPDRMMANITPGKIHLIETPEFSKDEKNNMLLYGLKHYDIPNNKWIIKPIPNNLLYEHLEKNWKFFKTQKTQKNENLLAKIG